MGTPPHGPVPPSPTPAPGPGPGPQPGLYRVRCCAGGTCGDSLRAHDADKAAVDAIADGVGADREVAGRHGRAIFAAHGRLFLAEVLPEPPVHDTARYGMLPDTPPLALQHAPGLGYAVVVHRPA